MLLFPIRATQNKCSALGVNSWSEHYTLNGFWWDRFEVLELWTRCDLRISWHTWDGQTPSLLQLPVILGSCFRDNMTVRVHAHTHTFLHHVWQLRQPSYIVCACVLKPSALLPRPQGPLVSGSICSPDAFCCSTSAGVVGICYCLCVSVMRVSIFSECVLLWLLPQYSCSYSRMLHTCQPDDNYGTK